MRAQHAIYSIFLALCTSCHGAPPESRPPAQPSAPAPRPSPELTVVETSEPGLTFKLHEGVAGADKQTPIPPAQAAKLTDAETQAVLARLAPIKTDADDQQEFAMRDKSLPPPRAGKTVKGDFPPPTAPPAPDATDQGPLTVVRHMPEGEVPLAPHVSITLSQPMVAVTSYAELEKLPIPAKLTPQPPGRWRWVGTKTLLFEPEGKGTTPGRFPMATVYTVEIPAGTRSATGGTLDQAASWTFSTPPPQVVNFQPQSGPTRRDPLLIAVFDQKIDPQQVLPAIHVKAAGQEVKLRLASDEEIKADPLITNWLANLTSEGQNNRCLVFRAQDLLPADAHVAVAIGPGTPSAEGPRKTDHAQEYSFRTYGPMRVTTHNCGKDDNCPPYSTFEVSFTNPIDTKKLKKDMVKVEPELPGLKIIASGGYLAITGQSKGRSTYKVTLSPTLPDLFGQSLDKSDTVSFFTKSAPRTLFATGGQFVVLDPTGGPRFSVYSVNHKQLKVKVFAESPETWDDFSKYMRETWSREKYPPDPPGRLLIDDTVTVKGDADELAETRIDLDKALKNGAGSVALLVEPSERPKNRWEWQPILVWVQVTRIGLDAMVDHGQLIGWATNLADGKPLEGVELSIVPSGAKGKTDDKGTASLPLGDQAGKMLVARKGDEVAFLLEQPSWWSQTGSWQKRPEGETLRWYVADDRQMYRPGEEVKLKGWIRRIGAGSLGDVGGLAGAASKIDYVLKDSQGNDILKGSAKLSALGGFDASFALPKTMNLGYANIQLASDGSLPGANAYHQIQVQEFRRPEFEVGAQASQGPFFVGGHATVSVSASYYAGGGLANADTTWSVQASPGSFTPPNRDDYVFGEQVSWWDDYVRSRESLDKNQGFSAHTDSSGKHTVGIDFLAVNPPRPMNVAAQATVMDVNRQAWSASASLLVHPASRYVGLKTERPFVQKNQPIKVEAILTDLDGKAVVGQPIHVRTVRLDWDFEDGEYRNKEVDPQDCELKSGDQPETCAIKTPEGGLYRVTALIHDDKGRANQTRILVWVAGGKLPAERNVTQEKVRLIPDKKEYHPGDTAEILVIPPWYPAEAVMTLRRSGIFKMERFTITGASHTLKVKVEDAWTPNLTVQVDLVGQAPRADDSGEINDKLPKRPAFASGALVLPIPPLTRKLALTVTPRDQKLEPGGETVVHLDLKDAHGEPVAGAEVAVVIVDESVLSLTGYRIPDPLPLFYSPREAGARDYHLRQEILLAKPEELPPTAPEGEMLQMEGAAPRAQPGAPPPSPAPVNGRSYAKHAAKQKDAFGDSSTASTEVEAIKVRSDFNALALFAPAVVTDARGAADVPVKLPDNLTRYRIMAVAVAGEKQFGAGESTITARLPLMVRPSAPRFLNFGDRFELPVVLQNQTDKPMEVKLAVRVANIDLTDGGGAPSGSARGGAERSGALSIGGRKVTVPANDRVEVRFPAAAMKAGIARFQLGAVAAQNPKWSDAAEVQLPVWTPATTEAFATYGTIDQGAISQPVKMPAGVFPQFGGLSITTSSTALQALTDAVLYLERYPYECSEQMASRMMSVASLKDVLGAFHADGLPSPEAMTASVDKDLEMLRRLQNYDGGWGFWKHGEESWPFLSIHVSHALARTKEKGFTVPQAMIDNVLPYLRDIESHIPAFYGVDEKRALRGYALYVRDRLGERDVVKALKLISDAGGVDKLPLEALGWIYPVLSGEAQAAGEIANIRKFLANRVEATAGAAHFTSSYSDGNYLLLHSDRRVDAIFLEGLITDQPKSDVIPKLVEGLLGHRKAGHWESTQEDAWVLLALDKYFNTYEKITPDFVAKAWLGPRYAGEHGFKGRTTERYAIDIPMRWLAEHKDQVDLVLAKEGAGRLYYRIGMDYAPTDLKMPPRDNGFTVERAYEAVDDPGDVRRDADGSWHVKAGARVRVRLTMVVPARRYHVALVDPLPAGLETMNPALAVTGNVPKDPKDQSRGGSWWWYGTWYEHQNLRDERAEAFTSLLWEGVHTYSYVARATTPGTFVVPPTKAEEMYHPETFGRGAGDRLVVE